VTINTLDGKFIISKKEKKGWILKELLRIDNMDPSSEVICFSKKKILNYVRSHYLFKDSSEDRKSDNSYRLNMLYQGHDPQCFIFEHLNYTEEEALEILRSGNDIQYESYHVGTNYLTIEKMS